jgi:hypothetical protein
VSEDRHSVDDLLRVLSGQPQVDPADLAYIESRVDAAIEEEKSIRQGRGPRTRILAWAAAVMVVIVGTSVVLQTARVSPAAAALEAIARAAETANPLTITDADFLYTRSETQASSVVPKAGLSDIPYDRDALVYSLSSTRETWFGSDDTVQIRTTVHHASFFTDEDEAAYYAAGLDQQDSLGITETHTVSDPGREEWPTDPGQLDQTIRERMTQDRGLPEPVEYLNTALNIIREVNISPELRAATLRLIADLDGVEHPAADSVDEPAEFFIEYSDQGVNTRLTFRIDGQGYLRFEERLNLEADTRLGVPARTPIFRAEYTRPTITEDLQTP